MCNLYIDVHTYVRFCMYVIMVVRLSSRDSFSSHVLLYHCDILQVSPMLPETFIERHIRVYVKEKKNEKAAKA